MSVSPLVSNETAAALSDLWTPFSMYLPDWDTNVVISSSFLTELDHALSASEKRMGLRSTPLKSVEAKLRATDNTETALLNNAISRMSMAKYLVPVFSDESFLTAQATQPTSTLLCDTTLRRFSAASRIAVINPGDITATLDFEILEIASKTDTSITLASPSSVTFLVGARVIPLIEARPSLSTRHRIVTESISEFSLKALESVGTTQLPATVTPGSLPPGFDTYKGLPVLGSGDYISAIQAGKSRYGKSTKAGIGFVITAEGTYVRPTFSLAMNSRNRAEAWSFINFFDSRAGKLFPFYVISPSKEFTTTTTATTGFVSPAAGPELDWGQFTDVALLLNDGTYLYRGISFLTRGGGNDLVLFDSSITTQQALDTIKIIPLYLSRLSSDTMKESWLTTEVMRSKLNTVAVHEEKSVTISDLTEIATTPVASAYNALQCSSGCWKLTNCNTPAEVIYVGINLVTLHSEGKFISLVEFPNKAWSISRSVPCGGSLTTPATLDEIYDTCPVLAQPNLNCTSPIGVSDSFDTTPECMLDSFGIDVGGTDGCGEVGSFDTADGKQYTWADSVAPSTGTLCNGTSCACKDEDLNNTGTFATDCIITVTRVS